MTPRFPIFPIRPGTPHRTRSCNPCTATASAKLGYSSLITAADANIGRVLQRLEELGLRDNTVVVFSADQGWCAGHHGVWGKGNGTIPYNMYEESIRVPLIWNHPRAIQPAAPTPMVSSYDFFPTLLDYLGIDAPPSDPRRVGRSYAAFLRGAPPRQWTNRLFFEYSYVRSLRTQTLKYVERGEGWPSELFDLEADPGGIHQRDRRPCLPCAARSAPPRTGSALQETRCPAHRRVAHHLTADSAGRIARPGESSIKN